MSTSDIETRLLLKRGILCALIVTFHLSLKRFRLGKEKASRVSIAITYIYCIPQHSTNAPSYRIKMADTYECGFFLADAYTSANFFQYLIA